MFFGRKTNFDNALLSDIRHESQFENENEIDDNNGNLISFKGIVW